MRDDPLLTILMVFAPISLTAFGGGLSVLSEVQNQAVNIHGWVSAPQFLNLFAIARSAPGPGSMLSTLLGWQVEGIAGAITATLAMFLPSSLLCVVCAFFWKRHRESRLVQALQRVVTPLGIGLMTAGAWSLATISVTSTVPLAISLISTAACLIWKNIHPLAILALGAILGVSLTLATH